MVDDRTGQDSTKNNFHRLMANSRDIEKLRKEIDQIDDGLLALINERARTAIMVGGEKAAFERATPVLKAMGQNVHHLGPSSSGTVIKLTNQLIVAIHT